MITFSLLQLSYVESESQELPKPLVLDADTLTKTLTSLTPNTDYTITLCASTSVGCGPVTSATNRTDPREHTIILHTHTFTYTNITFHSPANAGTV